MLVDHYLPGWKAGGPIRSTSNLVEGLGDQFDFLVITRDRDRDDAVPYPDTPLESWVPVGKANVFYAGPGSLSPRRLHRLITSVGPDLVYLNSVFSRLTIGYLLMRRLRRGRAAVVLNPRGEFDPGALSIKSSRKRVYLITARLLGLFSGVTWQASTPEEARHVRAAVGRAGARIAANLAAPPPPGPANAPAKMPGSARFVFIARVGPKKNLPALVKALAGVRGDVELGIYGRKFEAEWTVVERLIAVLPDGVAATYGGAPPHEEVDGILGGAHFYVLPTLAESFGHSIYEALSAGRPVVISDQTPWRGLAADGSGWDLPLDAPAGWVDVLQQCVDMDQSTYDAMSRAAHARARRWYDSEDRAAAHAAVFRAALDGPR